MKKSRLKENPFIVGILLFILAACFYDVFFLGKTFKVTTANSQALYYGVYGQENNKPKFIPVNGTDSSVLEEPLYEFIKKSLQKGILPLWNPHQACGYPFIGIIQVGMFCPLNFILYIFPQLFAWDLLILARFLLAGLFTYWLMKTLGFKKIPSLGAAIIFMLSGPMVLFQYWTVNVDILLPLLFIGIDRLVKNLRVKDIAFLSVIVALTFFGGHPEHIFLVNLYGVLFFGYRLFSLRKTTNYKKAISYFVLSCALGISMSAIVLLPFLRNILSEFWKGHPEGLGLLHEEKRSRAITLAIPYFFQRETLTYKFEFSGWWGGYLGILPLGLAFLSLFNKHKKGLNYFFATVGFLIISKAYGLFYINWIGHLPLLKMCRFTPHIVHLMALTIAILAGMGIRFILVQKKVFNKALIFSILLSLIIGIHLFIFRSAPHFKISLQASILSLAILICFQLILWIKEKNWTKKSLIPILLLVLITGELFIYIHHERPKRFDSFGKVPYIEYLKDLPERSRSYGIFWTFYPNTATAFGVDDMGVFLGLLNKRFVSFFSNLINPNIFKNDLRPPALRAIPITMGTPFLDLLNVKYTITPSKDMMKRIVLGFQENNENRPDPVYSKEVNIYERTDAFPRTFIVHRAIFEPDKENAYKILRAMQLKLREFVVINDAAHPLILQALKGTPIRDRSSSKIIKYTPNEVIVEASLRNPGFLVFSDAYHPDWKVFVDGKPSKLYEADCLIRSVFLGSGKHRLRFVFAPTSFYIGAIISGLSFLLLMILFKWDFILRKMRK